MKKIILTASWLAVAVYCSLSGLYGPAGLKVTTKADATVLAMVDNIEALERLNAEFAAEWNALRSDPELTAVQGRTLGFVAHDEVVVRLALPTADKAPAFIGERVVYTPAESIPEDKIRAISLYFWLGALMAGLAHRLIREKRNSSPLPTALSRAHRDMRLHEASRT